MKLINRKFILLIALAGSITDGVFGSVSGLITSGSEAGVWTTDVTAAQRLAKANNIFFISDYSKSSGCAYCTAADSGVYNTAAFRSWAKDNGIPLLYGDYVSGGSAATFASKYAGGMPGFPVTAMVSPDDGTTKLGATCVRSGVYVSPSGVPNTSTDFPIAAHRYSANTFAEWILAFEYLLNQIDNTPNAALRISAADRSDLEPPLNGLYRKYGTNTLFRLVYRDSNVNWSYEDDRSDWFVFSNPEAGRVYTISGEYTESEKDLGRVFIYDSKANADRGNESIEAASENCIASGYMSSLVSGGFEFEAPVAGDIYIQFTRRAPAELTLRDPPETFSLSYRFSLQEGMSQKYGFTASQAEVEAPRSGGFAAVTISRTNSKGRETIPYVLLGWGADDATAIESEDYDYPQGEHVFTFEDGSDTATVLIPIYDTKWDDTCHFYLAADVGDGLNEEWTAKCKVQIVDDTSLWGSGDDNFENAVSFNDPLWEDDGVYAAGTRLLPGDVADWFQLTNLAEGVIYKLTVSSSDIWWGLTGLCVQVYMADGKTALEGKAVSLDAESESGETLFVPVANGNYLIRVAPKAVAGGILYTEYGLKLESFTRPTLQFEKTEASFASPKADSIESFAVVSDRAAEIDALVAFSAVGVTAESGSDFVVDDSYATLSKGESSCEVSATLLDNKAGWRGERSFALRLEPGEFYALGEKTNLVVTIAADAAGNEHGATQSDALALALGDAAGRTSLLSAGPRNVSGAITDDWISVSGVRGGTSLIIQASDVVVKPAGTAVSVSILTNGVAMAGTFDLAAMAAAPQLIDLGTLGGQDNVVTIHVSRAAGANVLAEYNLGVREWVKPALAFKSDKVSVSDTNSTVTVTLVRTTEYKDVETPVSVATSDGTAVAGIDYRAFDAEVVIGTNETEKALSISLVPEDSSIWTGDRSFKVSLSLSDGLSAIYDLSGVTECTVTLVDADPELDDFDPGDDAKSGARVSTLTAIDGAVPLQGRLNGSDTSDWIKYTGAVSGQSYRFIPAVPVSLMGVSTNDIELAFTLPGESSARVVTLASVLAEGCWNTPVLTAGGDIYLQIRRPASALPVSCDWTVTAYEWPWPKMTFERGTDQISRDGDQTYAFKVVREDNLMLNDPDIVNYVTVWLEGDASKYAFSRETFAFVPGQLETNLVVSLNCRSDIWTGDETFSLKLAVETDESKEKIKAGAWTNLVVTVKDQTVQYDAADAADSVHGGASVLQNVDVRWNSVSAHLNGCEGRNTDDSIGDDTVDWYKFTNLAKGKMYRFEARNVVTANIDASAVTVSFYFDPSKAAIATKTLAELASSGYKTPKIDAESAIYAKVSRAAAGSDPVYVAYDIAYKMQANRTVYFKETSVSVRETASTFAVNVVCETDGEIIDLSDVTVKVTAEEDRDAAHPATSPSDFYAGTVATLVWPTNTVGGTMRVKVPLTNFDTVWEGDETFKLTLSCDEDTELGANKTIVVTLTDKEEPECGTVSLVRVGNPLANASESKTYAVREGDKFAVELYRTDGNAGAVTGVWTWASGAVERVPLFASREEGFVQAEITVPTRSGYQATAQTSCTLSLVGGAALAENSVSKLSFAVTDSDFAGKISEYSEDDLSRVPFRTSGAGWYTSVRNGTVCSAGASTLKATVKGPGTLMLTARIPSGVKLTANVSGVQKVLSNGVNSIEIGTGAKSVSIVATGAGADVYDVTFVPSDEFRTIGTFTGYASVGGVMGAATLTVAANGRISGKIACADRTWTYSANGGWNDGTIAVSAKSGRDQLAVVFSVDSGTGRVLLAAGGGEGRAIDGVLERTCWGDSPAQPAEAEALAACQGYYTATLPQASDGGETFGSGYLLITVGKTGSVKVSGVLADGQSVSMSGTLLFGQQEGETVPYVYLFAAPSAYKGGWFHAFARFAPKGDGGEIVLKPIGTTRWARFGQTEFDRATTISGGWYDKLESLALHYQNGLSVSNVTNVADYDSMGESHKAKAWGASAEIPSSFAFNAAGTKLVALGDPSGLFSISFTRSTGVFRGNEKVQYDVNGRTVTKSFSYRGALTPVKDEDDDVEGRGFFLMDKRSFEIEIAK